MGGFGDFSKDWEFDSVQGLVMVDVEVSAPLSERKEERTGGIPVRTKALIDTGAFVSGVSSRLVRELRLEPSVDRLRVRISNVVSAEPMYFVDLRIGGYTVSDLTVVGFTAARNPMYEVIVGMNLLKHSDFAVSNADRKTVFSIRFPPKIHIRLDDRTDGQ